MSSRHFHRATYDALKIIFWLTICMFCLVTSLSTKKKLGKRATRQAVDPRLVDCRNEALPLSGSPLRVFLTVSSLVSVSEPGRVLERQLELNWYGARPEEGDWIGLFSQEPSLTSANLYSSPVLLSKTNIGNRNKGFYRTDVSFPRPTLSSRILRTECLGFWVAYVRGNKTVATNCLRSHPDWMWENRQILGDFRVRDLFIPGTHDSGSYQEYNRKYDNVISRYTICQDENIWNQLAYGIRFLDFRIGFYRNNPEKYWLNHGEFKINPLKGALTDLEAFMNNSKEIVLLDFHNFPWGMETRDRHKELIGLIQNQLGFHMLPRSAGNDVTLNDMWLSNKRLLVFYNDAAFLESDLFWPGLQQRWGDKNDAAGLKTYLDNVMVMRSPTYWAAMAELTPTTGDIIKKPSGSLRILADQVNRNVTEWFRDLWWDKANVVATDFFHGNNMVEVAIEANVKRRLCWERIGRPVEQPRPSINRPQTGFTSSPWNSANSIPSAPERPSNQWEKPSWSVWKPPIEAPKWPSSTGTPSWSSWTPSTSSFSPNPNWIPQKGSVPPSSYPPVRPPFWGPSRYLPAVPQPVVPGPPPYHHQQQQQEAQLNRIGRPQPFPPHFHPNYPVHLIKQPWPIYNPPHSFPMPHYHYG